MTWETPKTNWNTSDGIGYADLNRIESNILGVRNATVRKVQGFGYLIYNNVVGYDGIVAIQPGSCYSAGGYPIRQDTEFRKNLTTWALGSGNDKGGMASAVTVGARKWYYIYAILNSSTGDIDFMFDDQEDGSNIPSGTYDQKRYIGAFKTRDAGGNGSYDICEMFSTGDHTFMNPSNFYTDREIEYSNTNNDYFNLELKVNSPLENFALPARLVTAKLNAYSDADDAFGFVSNYGNFTIPGSLVSGGIYAAEVLCKTPNGSLDFEIVVDTDRKVQAAYNTSSGSKNIWVAVRGFHDERLI